MAEDHESQTFRVKAAPRYSKSSTSRSRLSYGSYETGESSADASALYDPSPPLRGDPDGNDNARNKRRSYRPRPSGGFLLPNSVANDRPARPREKALPRQDGARRRSRIPVDSRRKGKSPVGTTSDRSDSSSSSTFEMGTDAKDMEGDYAVSRHRQERRPSPNARPVSSSRIPSPRPNAASLDMDSTQIVNMALNLSESRRIAQRRHVSSPAPPRLAPLPDSPSGGGLKQHLQKQRRTSRNLSPQPETNAPLKNISASNPRVNSPLHQGTFDPEGNYTYHFSASTLNRAQKAKEHFELMAQHRRLLQLIPPLDHGLQENSRPSTSSLPNSPTNGTSSQNPFNSNSYVPPRSTLQPTAVHTQSEGSSKREKSNRWRSSGLLRCVQGYRLGRSRSRLCSCLPFHARTRTPPIPPFSGAQMPSNPQQQPSSIPVPVSATAKPKRPRIDWIIDPADMLADVNWVEQDDNKLLLEDRHYARIFPTPAASSSRPLSHQGEESAASSLRARQSIEHGHDDIYVEPKPSDSNAMSKADTDLSHTSARERARHKLHELRGMHHRHNSSVHSHHDFLNFRRSSFSDTSESETDRKRRGRSGTVSADSKAVLEKQMNELMAREAIEERKRSLDEETDNRKQIHSTHMTPDKSFEPPAQGHTRVGEREKDRGVDQINVIKEESIGSPIEPVESSTLSPASTESLGNIGRARSRSPAPKIASRNTGESHKSHKSMGSLRLGRDDQIGLRTIFKGGAKIDGIIRGGVSKVSDLLWKKDQDDDGSTSDTSSDESHHGLSRERSDGPEPSSQTESTLPQENRQAKHYLDVMPTFKSASDVDKSASPEAGVLDVPVNVSSPPNRRSSRFDKLKPPRIDVMSASPASTPLAQLKGDPFDSGVSESESDEQRTQVVDGARNSTGQLNAVMTVPALSKGSATPWAARAIGQSPIRRRYRSGKPSSRNAKQPAFVPLGCLPAYRGMTWRSSPPAEQANLAVSQRDLYATSARILSSGVETSSFTLENQMHAFAQNEVRHLHGRADALHQRIATELIDMTRRAADDADECSRDINDGQRLKVKHVLDVIDNLMRRKRRRFRWASARRLAYGRVGSSRAHVVRVVHRYDCKDLHGHWQRYHRHGEVAAMAVMTCYSTRGSKRNM
ncbi:hypothetical protein PG997_009407 [Apiospora hydei]|uniref:Uncharacterized protein n=1 Tax=Apiospora hydei TaxID=1337664 RepID=A0ABR1VU12_9PEZI